MTKVSDNAFESGDQISVYAYSGTDLYADNALYTYSGTQFASDSPIVYLSESQTLSFYAIYPYNETSATSFSFEIAQDQTSNSQLSDLLVANTVATGESTPTLQFNHKLSKVLVNITDENVETAQIQIMAKNIADCDILEETYAASGSNVAITPAELGGLSYSAIVAPQTISLGEVFLSVVADGKSYELYVSNDIALESGYIYTCDVSVATGEVVFQSIVNPWDDGGEIVIEDEDEKGPEIESITIVSNTYKSLLVDTKLREDFTATYAIVPVYAPTLESYDDYLSYAQSFATSDIAYYGTDYTVADGIYVFEGEVQSFNIFSGWNPSAGTSYYILAFGVDADGIVCTEVTATESFIVAEDVSDADIEFPDVDFGTIEVSNIASNSFDYDIYPTDTQMTYLAFTSTKTDYDSAGSAEERFAADMTYLDSYLSYYYSTSVDEGGLSKIVNTGNLLDRSATSLSSDTEYVIYAYGVDVSTVQPLTQIKAVEVTTEPYTASEGQINSVTVTSIDMTDATISVDAGDYEGIYYVYSLLTSQITSYYGGDPEAALLQYLYVETLIGTDLSTANGVKTFQGDLTDHSLSTAWTIAPNNVYTVIVAGVTPTGTVVSEIVTTEFTSGTLSEDFNITLEMSDITETGAIVTTTLSQEGINYMTEFLESTDCVGMTDDDVCSYFETLYGGWISLAIYSQSGSQDLEGYLQPGRTYTIFSYSYYANAGRLSDVFRLEFTTPGTYVPDVEESPRLQAPWLNYNGREVAQQIELNKITAEGSAVTSQKSSEGAIAVDLSIIEQASLKTCKKIR